MLTQEKQLVHIIICNMHIMTDSEIITNTIKFEDVQLILIFNIQ